MLTTVKRLKYKDFCSRYKYVDDGEKLPFVHVNNTFEFPRIATTSEDAGGELTHGIWRRKSDGKLFRRFDWVGSKANEVIEVEAREA